MQGYRIISGALACTLIVGCGERTFSGESAIQRRDASGPSAQPEGESNSSSADGLRTRAGEPSQTTMENEQDAASNELEDVADVAKDRNLGDKRGKMEATAYPDDTEAGGCLPGMLGGREMLKIAGNQTEQMHEIEDEVSVKITGNQNILTLRIPAGADIGPSGICIFVAGNENRVVIDIAGKVSRLTFKGRGNQSMGLVNVASGGSLTASQIDLAGSRSTVTFEGAGEYVCESGMQAGRDTQIKCSKL